MHCTCQETSYWYGFSDVVGQRPWASCVGWGVASWVWQLCIWSASSYNRHQIHLRTSQCIQNIEVPFKWIKELGGATATLKQLQCAWAIDCNKDKRPTWYLRCCQLCLDLSEALSTHESTSHLWQDLKLLIWLVNALSIALHISCVSLYFIFWTKWSMKTCPAEIFQGDLGSPAMSIMKLAVVASQALVPWPVCSHLVENPETQEGSGVWP